MTPDISRPPGHCGQLPLRTIIERAETMPDAVSIVYDPGFGAAEVVVGYGELARRIAETATFLRRELDRHDPVLQNVVGLVGANTLETYIVAYAAEVASRCLALNGLDIRIRSEPYLVPTLLRACNVRVAVVSNYVWDSMSIDALRSHGVARIFNIDGPARTGSDGTIVQGAPAVIPVKRALSGAAPPVVLNREWDRGHPHDFGWGLDNLLTRMLDRADDDVREAMGFDHDEYDLPGDLQRVV